MKKILVIGFGAMGCRHVQSLLGHKDQYDIHVVEPSGQIVEMNTERIGAKPGDFTRHEKLDAVPDGVDLAIVATSSGPRYQIVKQLLENNVRLFLLEKIVFQSEQQFHDIIQLLEKHNAKAYCNFVNRYFGAYNQIKQAIETSRAACTMVVHGGEFGLGCNAIHYIDIFQYLNGSNELTMNGSLLSALEIENRRGKEYREFTGLMNIADKAGNKLTLIAEKDFSGGVTIDIQFGNSRYILSEQTQKMFSIEEKDAVVAAFTIVPTSRLTHTIAQDIFSGNCRLTQVAETAQAHSLLFNSFNKIIYTTTDQQTLCPIT